MTHSPRATTAKALRRKAGKSRRSRTRARLFAKELENHNCAVIQAITGTPPLGTWQRAVSDLCYEEGPLRDPGHLSNTKLSWVDLADSILKNPGEEALEATWRLGGEEALKRLVQLRASALRNGLPL